MSMTWDEFKESVDKTINDKGYDGSYELIHLNVEHTTNSDKLVIGFNSLNRTMVIAE
tara:strand:+ start:777 stop:947 length:171 start_codon:yes stop_codon:yes gene_type:complete